MEYLGKVYDGSEGETANGYWTLNIVATQVHGSSMMPLLAKLYSCIRRWAIEETIRYIKQSYEIEDVRVLTYESLKNIMPLVCAAAYFAAVLLDTASKLKVMAGYVLKSLIWVFGIPNFHYYSIADGLTSIFMRHPGPITIETTKEIGQGVLFPSSA